MDRGTEAVRGQAPDTRTAGCGIRGRPFGDESTIRNYWTVMVPFMFIAACGVQL
jgi:hypothetical protein